MTTTQETGTLSWREKRMYCVIRCFNFPGSHSAYQYISGPGMLGECKAQLVVSNVPTSVGDNYALLCMGCRAFVPRLRLAIFELQDKPRSRWTSGNLSQTHLCPPYGSWPRFAKRFQSHIATVSTEAACGYNLVQHLTLIIFNDGIRTDILNCSVLVARETGARRTISPGNPDSRQKPILQTTTQRDLLGIFFSLSLSL